MPRPLDMTKLVKPLIWRELRDGNHRPGECFSTRSPVSFSPIAVHKKHDGWWLNVDCKTYPDLEAAQSAANADHAARVIDALDADLIAELVGALGWYASDAAWTVNQIVGADGDYGAKARAILARLGVTP